MTNSATQNVATLFLPTAEGRIAFDVTGVGPLVVLVPGTGDLRSSYRFLVPELVAAGYTAVTTDLRGHGESDAGFGSYGDGETARDVTALVQSMHRPAFIIGNSMAAGSAVLVAAAQPDLVKGLVLVGPFVREPATSSALSRGFLRVLMAKQWGTSLTQLKRQQTHGVRARQTTTSFCPAGWLASDGGGSSAHARRKT